MRKRRISPVLREAEFIAELDKPGTWVEIECLTAPDPKRRHRGEWIFFAVRGPDERYSLVTARADDRIVQTMEGVVSFAATKLELDQVTVPLLAGGIATGMRRRPRTG
jgi:hypothetical protein